MKRVLQPLALNTLTSAGGSVSNQNVKSAEPHHFFAQVLFCLFQYDTSTAVSQKKRVTVICQLCTLQRGGGGGIFWFPWVCFIICPLWLCGLWQFVQLGPFVCCLVADFCLTERNLDSERKRNHDREMGRHGGAELPRFWQPLILQILNTLSHSWRRSPFPLLNGFMWFTHMHTFRH